VQQNDFIQNLKRKIKVRTPEEVLEQLKIVILSEEDWMGTMCGDLLKHLPFELAKEFLKPGVKEEDWGFLPLNKDSVIAEMKEYMPFAWKKANERRGLSAGRSMDHYTTWIWLAGDDLGELRDYEYYGKDNLTRICKQYGWDSTKWDDTIRIN
jgi:hypothetical protein